jgi:hypothetical protein
VKKKKTITATGDAAPITARDAVPDPYIEPKLEHKKDVAGYMLAYSFVPCPSFNNHRRPDSDPPKQDNYSGSSLSWYAASSS